MKFPYLRSIIAVAMWDAVVASVAYLFLIPVLVVASGSFWLLLGYVIDIPAVMVPILYKAAQRREIFRALTSIPSFFILRTVNAYFMLEAIVTEIVLKKRFCVYEKGH